MSSQFLSPLGAACLPAYFVVTLVIGWFTRSRPDQSANAFLNASRSLPLPVVVASFLAANCGALEVVGMSAMAAQYGVRAFHFYWIGAIPAMVFLGLWMLPVYRNSGVRSVPEYLGLRYGRQLEALYAVAIGLTMLMLAGISLYAMAQVLQVVLQIKFSAGVSLSAAVVLVYVLIGGVRATIYTEVFQLLVMILGLAPLALRCLLSLKPEYMPASGWSHAWVGLPVASQQGSLDGLGVVFGLGFVLSFGYWCTDFVLMQRALAARTELEARQVPLWAGFGKLLFGFVVVLPGLAVMRMSPDFAAQHRYDQALPFVMTKLYGSTYLGLGLTALAASLMSGLAANVSGVSAVWTEDLYRRHMRPDCGERHYVRMGRISTSVAMGLSAMASVISFHFADLMEHVQLIFSLLNAPFWAVFLLGITTRRTTQRGAFNGFVCGVFTGALHSLAVARGWIQYGSAMNANLHVAVYSFCTTAAVTLGMSMPGSVVDCSIPLRGGSRWRVLSLRRGSGKLLILSSLLLAVCLLCNLLWR